MSLYDDLLWGSFRYNHEPIVGPFDDTMNYARGISQQYLFGRSSLHKYIENVIQCLVFQTELPCSGI